MALRRDQRVAAFVLVLVLVLVLVSISRRCRSISLVIVDTTQADDDSAIVAWRERMVTDEANKLYRARASLCELMNAHLRTHHGVDHFLVRGLAKVTCVALLGAIASNLLQHAATLLA